MKNLKLVFTIFFALSAASLVAQSRHYNAATLGMGGGGTAFIDGYQANFLNPANLMIKNYNRPRRQLGFSGVGASFGGSLLNFSVYNEYLTEGLTIEGPVRENMINDWFGSDPMATRDVNFGLDIVPLGFSTRRENMALSFATRVRTLQDLTMNRGLMELGFYGLDSDQFGNGVPINFNSSTLSYAEISVGYAMELPLPLSGIVEALPFINGMKVFAGVAPKYIVGLQSFELDFSSDLRVDPVSQTSNGGIRHNFNYTANVFGDLATEFANFADEREADPDAEFNFDYAGSDIGSLGNGFGLDMGITAELDISLPVLSFFGDKQKLRVAMSATDLGSVTFTENPQSITASGNVVIDGDAGDQNPGDYWSDFADSLSNDVYGGFGAQEGESGKFSLPGMYNFGAALQLGKLTTTLDYGFGFNDLGTNSRRSALTLGAEYRLLGIIPLRVGTRVGGFAGTSYSAGIGLDLNFLEFTVAAAAVANSETNGSAVTAAWSGLVFRF